MFSKFYLLKIYRNKVTILGLSPCIIIADLKILAPAHTLNAVNINTPKSPAKGCQTGMITDVACLNTISIGVQIGNNDKPVAKLLKGLSMIGIIKLSK